MSEDKVTITMTRDELLSLGVGIMSHAQTIRRNPERRAYLASLGKKINEALQESCDAEAT